MRAGHERYLLELTGLPTASGREDRVIAWVQRWARRRKSVELSHDRYGNLLLKRAGARSRRPILFTAHMDHPAFVVVEQTGPREVLAEFRGGVEDRYFKGSRVRLHCSRGTFCPGRVAVLSKPGESAAPGEPREASGDKRVLIKLTKPVVAKAGDVLTWNLPAPKIARGRLRAPACDDLAGVAAALSAFEVLNKTRTKRAAADVCVLLTRAEEVGFIGAIGACKSGLIPKAARLVALETSKSFPDSPIGAGPIVRVGDRTSSFDPDLTYRIGQIAQRIQQHDPDFNWQRKLMPGGTCEASAYQALGYTATCLCLPLGNYHNMNPGPTPGSTPGLGMTPGLAPARVSKSGRPSASGHSHQAASRRASVGPRIDSEVISIADYHGLIRLLIEIGRTLDQCDASPPLRDRMDQLFARRRGLLG